jgi:hypothetical protein
MQFQLLIKFNVGSLQTKQLTKSDNWLVKNKTTSRSDTDLCFWHDL